jgi:hypothetical protein
MVQASQVTDGSPGNGVSMNDDNFTEQLWKAQIEVAKVAQMMEQLRLNNLSINVVGKEYEWVFHLVHLDDHADDERRASHGD